MLSCAELEPITPVGHTISSFDPVTFTFSKGLC